MARYRIVERIGAGGMGVVYRAEDLVLKRTVALKVLSGQHLENPQARARFLRESRVAAALNHPNICTIHEVGEVKEGEASAIEGVEELSAGTPYIVMELVQGRTLDSLLSQAKPLPLQELLRIAVHISEGMAEAHAKGIVHRDLKPQNVVVGPQGRVKVLDFGLAKPLASGGTDDQVLKDAASASVELTLEGMVIGTVTYMSPEQAQGRPADSRSDVFSFGILLYEMATGQRPFGGDTAATVMAKILETDPDPVSSIRPDLPPELGRIARRCLKKAPEDRYNDTRDLVAALKDLRQGTTSEQVRAAPSPAARRSRLVVGASVCAVLIAVAVIALLGTRGQDGVAVPSPVHQQVTFSGKAEVPAISPDGSHVAYVVSSPVEDLERLIVQALSGGSPLEVFRAWRFHRVRWSPDGEMLVCSGFDESAGYSVWIIPRLGGTPERLGFYANFVAWSPDGSTLAYTKPHWRALKYWERASGAKRHVELEDPDLWILDLDWSATSDLLLYVTHDESDRGAIRVASADGRRQALVIEESGSIPSARWSPRGDAIYYLHRRGTSTEIRSVHVDPASGERRGQPRFVISLPQADGQIGLSADGKRLVYLECNNSSNLWLASMAKEGAASTPKWEQLTTGTYIDRAPRFSPSGTSIVFSRGIGSKQNVFVLDLSTGEPRQLTFSDSLDLSPVWSPDGTAIAFVSDRTGKARIWRVSTVGGEPTPVESGEVGLRSDSLDWATTGTILFRPPDYLDLYAIDSNGGEERSLREGIEDPAFQPLPTRRYVGMTALWAPRFSPDGQRVAATWSGDRGRVGLWSLPVTGGAVVRLLPGAGPYPIGWSSDGSVVYVVTGLERPMRVVKIRVSDGEREDVCELPFDEIFKREGHVSPDGRKLVIPVRHTESDVWLVENFDPDVK